MLEKVEISEDFYFASVRHHEAGHAVVWWDVGVDVDSIEVWKSGFFRSDSKGLVTPVEYDEENLFNHGIGMAAGALAQDRFFVEHGVSRAQAERISEECSGGDDEYIQYFSSRLGISRSTFRDRAEASLEVRWELVRVVAAMLNSSAHLPGSVAR